MSNGQNHFNEQLISVILGALIGFTPSLFLLRLQAKQQLDQLRFDRQLGALKDFSEALSANGQLFAKDGELEGILWEMTEASKPERELLRLQRANSERELFEDQYVANLHAESLVMTSVFGVRFKVLDYAQVGDIGTSLKPGMSVKEIRELTKQTVQKESKAIADWHRNLIDFIETYESELSAISAKLNP
jgi:hypothetical protein